MSTTTAFTNLPTEVQDKVAPYLSQQDLAHCLQVCRAWKQTFHRHLWTHIQFEWVGDNKTWQKNLGRGLKSNRQFIRSIKMRIHEDDHFQSFLKQCPPSFPLLTAADIKAPFEDDYNYTKNDVLRFANMSSEGWKRLVFRKDKEAVTVLEFNKRPFDQLLKVVAPTLQVFRTYSLRLVNMRAVNKLLCTAPNLKELYIYIGSDGAEEYWLDAEEIVDSEWVCDNLEVFGCRIGNIPRPDITRDVDGVPWADYFGQGLKEESINLQHQVYAKLARFTKLRELSLGFPLNSEDAIYDSDYTEHYQQYDCLAMTVDSGLDLLKGLQNLRNVGLTNMTAYIAGEKEKAWFKENWPNVKFEVFDEIANEENEDSSEEEWLTEDDEDHHFSE